MEKKSLLEFVSEIRETYYNKDCIQAIKRLRELSVTPGKRCSCEHCPGHTEHLTLKEAKLITEAIVADCAWKCPRCNLTGIRFSEHWAHQSHCPKRGWT